MTQACLKKKKHLAVRREQKFLDLSSFIITLLKKECEREREKEGGGGVIRGACWLFGSNLGAEAYENTGLAANQWTSKIKFLCNP